MLFDTIFTNDKKKDLDNHIRNFIKEHPEYKKSLDSIVKSFDFIEIWWNKVYESVESRGEFYIKLAKYYLVHPELDRTTLENEWDKVIVNDYYTQKIRPYIIENSIMNFLELLNDKGFISRQFVLGISEPRNPLGRVSIWSVDDLKTYLYNRFWYYKEFKKEFSNILKVMNEV